MCVCVCVWTTCRNWGRKKEVRLSSEPFQNTQPPDFMNSSNRKFETALEFLMMQQLLRTCSIQGEIRSEAPLQGWCVWGRFLPEDLGVALEGVPVRHRFTSAALQWRLWTFIHLFLIACALEFWCFCFQWTRIKAASRFVWIWGFSTLECWFISPSW